MKILTPRKNKDYYDYLSGIYGIDEKVVYDRRRFTVLKSLDTPFFNYKRLETDRPKKEDRYLEWNGRKHQWVTKHIGVIYKCMLEVGLKWYFLETERFLDDSTNVCIDWKLVKTMEISKSQHLGKTPMTFIKAFNDYTSIRRGTLDIRVDEKNSVSNPILSGTPIPAIISPQDLYNDLSSYISSLNDKEFVDNRTDVQKAESAGFNRNTSFRNVK